jgi:hypothetical protein
MLPAKTTAYVKSVPDTEQNQRAKSTAAIKLPAQPQDNANSMIDGGVAVASGSGSFRGAPFTATLSFVLDRV